MNAFNEWFKENYGEIPMNKDNKPPLQFTELTLNDVRIHESLYVDLLIDDRSIGLGEKGVRLLKAKRMFCEAFE